MKQKLKLFAFLFGISVMLVSCNNDDSHDHSEQGIKSGKKNVSFSMLKKQIESKSSNYKLSRIIERTEKEDISFTGKSSDEFIVEIDTTEIVQAYLGSNISYTVRVITSDDNPEEYFTNMVLFEKDGQLEATYYRYTPTETWKNNTSLEYSGSVQRLDSNGNVIAGDVNSQNSTSRGSLTVCTISMAPVWLCS